MRFFSKLVVICNVCFVIAIILREVEFENKQKGSAGDVILLKPVESTLVILGYGAIFINIIFLIVALSQLLIKKKLPIAKWIIWFNLLLFIYQVYWFFIDTSK